MRIINPPVRTIDKDFLSFKIKKNDPMEVVNVLDPENYKLGFIKGSKRIPLDVLEDRLQELDKNKEIITYSSDDQSTAPRKAAEKLANRGFKVRIYEGGIKEWKEANLPLEN
jgi:rhodanese-related sulfurtransferase